MWVAVNLTRVIELKGTGHFVTTPTDGAPHMTNKVASHFYIWDNIPNLRD
jgi:hypothetical protein